jgi:hypothetical protein
MHFAPYQRRPVRFLELWHSAGWRLKVYCIASGRPSPRPELVSAAKDWAASRLKNHPTRQTSYGVGFLGVHDGHTENQVFLDRWANENELLHTFVTSPSEAPTRLSIPNEDHNSVCVWDLAVQCFERQAWLTHVLANPRGPDLAAYLATTLNAEL